MNKYRNPAIVLTSICSLGLASISLAQDGTGLKNNQNLEKITAPDISSLLNSDDQANQNIEEIAATEISRLINSDEKISVTTISSLENLFDDKNNNIEVESLLTKDSSLDKVAISFKPNIEEFLTKALEVIREFEGFREQAYIDTDGTPVIGYGLSKVDGRKVRLGDSISVAKADAVLSKQVLHLQEQIKSMVKVELNNNQLSALSSFAFNVGIHGVKRSTLLKKLNAGDYVGAANEFVRWNKAHVRGQLVPLAGLTRRREAEKQLFLK